MNKKNITFAILLMLAIYGGTVLLPTYVPLGKKS